MLVGFSVGDRVFLLSGIIVLDVVMTGDEVGELVETGIAVVGAITMTGGEVGESIGTGVRVVGAVTTDDEVGEIVGTGIAVAGVVTTGDETGESVGRREVGLIVGEGGKLMSGGDSTLLRGGLFLRWIAK